VRVLPEKIKKHLKVQGVLAHFISALAKSARACYNTFQLACGKQRALVRALLLLFVLLFFYLFDILYIIVEVFFIGISRIAN